VGARSSNIPRLENTVTLLCYISAPGAVPIINVCVNRTGLTEGLWNSPQWYRSHQSPR